MAGLDPAIHVFFLLEARRRRNEPAARKLTLEEFKARLRHRSG
jgi:hypothetical protein